MDHNINDIPVDITAALATSKAPKHSRRHREPNDILNVQKQLAVLIQPALETNPSPDNGLPDFRGKQFGRLTVIAFAGRIRHAYWVVRCQCGNHEVRRHGSVVKAHQESMCMECKQDIMAKEHYDFHHRQRLSHETFNP